MAGNYHVGAAAPGQVTPTSEKAPDAANVGGPVDTETQCLIFEQPTDDGKRVATLNKASDRFPGDGHPTTGQHTNTHEVTAKTRAARVYLDLLPEAAIAHGQAAAKLDWQAGLARGGAFRAKGTRDAPADPRRIKRRIARHLKKQQASRSKAGTQGGGHV